MKTPRSPPLQQCHPSVRPSGSCGAVILFNPHPPPRFSSTSSGLLRPPSSTTSIGPRPFATLVQSSSLRTPLHSMATATHSMATAEEAAQCVTTTALRAQPRTVSSPTALQTRDTCSIVLSQDSPALHGDCHALHGDCRRSSSVRHDDRTPSPTANSVLSNGAADSSRQTVAL